MIQKSPRVNESLLILRMAKFLPHVLSELHGERSAEVAGRRWSTAAHTGLQRRSAMRFVPIETSKATGGRPALVVLAVADDVTSGVFAYQRRGFSQFRSCNSSATVFAYECSMSRSSTIGAEKKLN